MADRGMAVAGRPRDWRRSGVPGPSRPPGEGVRRRARQLLYGKCRRKVVETRAPPRPSSVLFTPVSCCRRRTGADPVSARPRMVGPALKHDAKGCCCFDFGHTIMEMFSKLTKKGVKVSKPTNKTSTPSGPPGQVPNRCSELVRNFRLPQSCPARRRSGG